MQKFAVHSSVLELLGAVPFLYRVLTCCTRVRVSVSLDQLSFKTYIPALMIIQFCINKAIQKHSHMERSISINTGTGALTCWTSLGNYFCICILFKITKESDMYLLIYKHTWMNIYTVAAVHCT